MRQDLQRRIAALSDEIRRYPTPIARCDEQLTQLIEERAEALRQLQRLTPAGACSPLATWINDGGFHAA